MMVEFLNSKANQVQIHGWRVQTLIDGEISAFEGPAEGQYIIQVNNQDIVDIGFYHDDLLRISTAKGYAVQMIISEKFISVIKEA